jgi:RNA exonuclease 4
MLAEVALVDWDGHVVYQTYVQPTGPVVDYRESITGITPDMLTAEKEAKPFGQVQEEVLHHLQGKILVGHALENDLKALQIRVPNSMIRNTAHHPFFQSYGPRGQLQPQKLAKLYETYVGNVEIQKGTHGAAEDAAASMRVYKTYHNSWNTPVQHYGPFWRQEKNERSANSIYAGCTKSSCAFLHLSFPSNNVFRCDFLPQQERRQDRI